MRLLNNMAFIAITLPVCVGLAVALYAVVAVGLVVDWICEAAQHALPDWLD